MKTGLEKGEGLISRVLDSFRDCFSFSFSVCVCRKTEKNVLTWEMKTGVKRRTDTSSAEILGQILHLGSQSGSGKTGL